MKRARIRRWSDSILTLVFLAGMIVPLVMTWRNADGSKPLAENRMPAPPPKWNISIEFPHKFEAYFNDRFGLRNELVQAHNWLKARVFKVSPTPNVMIGKAGWLYYFGEETFRDSQGRQAFGKEQLDHWQSALEQRRDRLAKRGIAYLFVVVPNKQTIYPEFVPDEWNRPGQTRLDQFVEHMRENSTVEVLDLRPALLAAKERDQVYCKTDSHWNDRGVYVGYDQIMKPVAERFPQVQPWPRSDFFDTEVPNIRGDLSQMLGSSIHFDETWYVLLPLRPRVARIADACMSEREKRLPDHDQPAANELDDRALPRAIVLHDSFGLALRPFLAPHFQRVLFLRQRHLETAVVERERPHIVIQEICERFLWDPNQLLPDVDDDVLK